MIYIFSIFVILNPSIGVSQQYDVTRVLNPGKFTTFKNTFSTEEMEPGYTRRIECEFSSNLTSFAIDVYWLNETGYSQFQLNNDTNDIDQENILDEVHHSSIYWFQYTVYLGYNRIVHTIIINSGIDPTEYSISIWQGANYSTPSNPIMEILTLVALIGILVAVIIIVIVVLIKRKNKGL